MSAIAPIPCSLCGRSFDRGPLTKHHCLPRQKGGTDGGRGTALPAVSRHGPRHLHQRHAGRPVSDHRPVAPGAGTGPLPALGAQAAAHAPHAKQAAPSKTVSDPLLSLPLARRFSFTSGRPLAINQVTTNGGLVLCEVHSRKGNTRVSSGGRPPVWARYALTSAVALAAWIPWRFSAESPSSAWMCGCGPTASRRFSGRRSALRDGEWSLPCLGPTARSTCCARIGQKCLARAAGFTAVSFLVVGGPINEVLWNSVIWTAAGMPLYQYTMLPTFSGSGSYLSPLYYLTLLLGFWLDERVPGPSVTESTGRSGQRRNERSCSGTAASRAWRRKPPRCH